MALLTPLQAANFNPPDTSVQMFRWRWTDIAKECTNWLGPQGYGAVQVSPPHASRYLGTWYDVYQPVNYTKLNSLMGTETEFQTMINTCHAAKVRIYADVVVNHLAAGSGTATDGSTWNSGALIYPYFSGNDFHPACAINASDYQTGGNRNNVLLCRLENLPDLKSESDYVQGQVRNYLNKLVAMGVDGVRLDAAKHIAPAAITAILNGASLTTISGEPLWFTQEILPDGTTPIADYFANGTINEFHYTYAMKEMFRNINGTSVSQLPTIMGIPGSWGGTWGFLPSEKATVFVNNWDTERNGSSLTATDYTGALNDTSGNKRYDLANILMLAWPYGSAQIHSGFRFTDKNTHPPFESPFDADDQPLINQSWDFIHRWPEISNMVAFRNVTAGEAINYYTYSSANQVAFSRGRKGFVAINNEGVAWVAGVKTGLPAGEYCNVVVGVLDSTGNGCTGDTVSVDSNGVAAINIGPNDGKTVSAVALHIKQKIGAQ